MKEIGIYFFVFSDISMLLVLTVAVFLYPHTVKRPLKIIIDENREKPSGNNGFEFDDLLIEIIFDSSLIFSHCISNSSANAHLFDSFRW